MFIWLFVCLFVYGFVCLFYFNHHGTPTGSFPENFMKIRLDLAQIFRIWNFFYLFVCLFVYEFVCCFVLIILGHPQEVSLTISSSSDLFWLRFVGSNFFICLFVCSFICLFVHLFFIFCWNHLVIPAEGFL